MSFNFSYRNTFDSVSLNLYTCGKESCESMHFYGPALRSGYLIHIVLSGKGIYKVNNQEYHLKAGDGFLIHPEELIFYEADQDEPWEYIWVGFIGTKVNDYLSRTTLSKSNPVFTLSEDSNLINSIYSVISATIVNNNKNLKILSSLYDFFYVLLEEFPNNTENKKVAQQTYLEEALLFIQSNYQDDISVMDVANHLCIDRSYLHRIFKKHVNIPPQEYILNLKIEKAAFLLTTTTLKIGDISRSVGYSDTLLFSKMFKKFKDCTPSKYREVNSI